jgi:hypothetical protein
LAPTDRADASAHLIASAQERRSGSLQTATASGVGRWISSEVMRRVERELDPHEPRLQV